MCKAVDCEGELISNQPTLLSIEFDLFFFYVSPLWTMRSAINMRSLNILKMLQHRFSQTTFYFILDSPHSSDDEETAMLKSELRRLREQKTGQDNETKKMLLRQVLEEERRAAAAAESMLHDMIQNVREIPFDTFAQKKIPTKPAHPRSLIRLFVIHIKKLCILCYTKCALWRFWLDCANAVWSESSLARHVRSYFFCRCSLHVLFASYFHKHVFGPANE